MSSTPHKSAPVYPPKPSDQALRDVALASVKANQGSIDDAFDLVERHIDPEWETIMRPYARIAMLKATKDANWDLGLSAWEQLAEHTAIANIWDDGNRRGMAGFFLRYAEHLLATGDQAGAVGYAKKARRLFHDQMATASPALLELLGEG